MSEQQSGFMDTFTCFSQGLPKSECYQFLIKMILAILLFVFAIIIFFRRRKQDILFTRKQTIITIIIIDLAFYLAYNWSSWSPLLYFPVSYFQYIFFCYILYYFGRKSIILSTLNAENQMEISASIQIKLSKLIFMGLTILFTTIYVLNYVDYFITNNYTLCKASFFNIITIVGFFVEGLFVLQMRQLSNHIRLNLEKHQDKEMIDLETKIIKRLKYLWILVIVCFLGSFTNFIENIYFVVMNAKQQNFTCTYINIPDNYNLQITLNSVIDLVERIFTFFVPYMITLKLFWDKLETVENKEEISSSLEQYTMSYQS